MEDEKCLKIKKPQGFIHIVRDMASNYNLNLSIKVFHSKLYKPDIIEKSIGRCFPIVL